MNFYKRFVGDYARDTGHLSMLEHGAYNLLLDWYYANESPIPADKAYRIGKAGNKDERKAVDFVLAEFFTKSGESWVSGRCESEISKTSEKSTKASASANTRWSQYERNANASEPHMRSASLRNASQTPDSREDQERPTDLSPADANDDQPAVKEFIPAQQVADAYNEICGDIFPAVCKLTDKRRKAIRSRWLADANAEKDQARTNNLGYWRRYFAYCRNDINFFRQAASGELHGAHAGWRPDFDFLMRESTWLGVKEGKYQ